MDDSEQTKFKQISSGIIDSHAHLLNEFYGQERDLIIGRMFDLNIRQMINPAVDLKAHQELLELAKHFANIFIGVGLHPHQAFEWDDQARQNMRIHINDDKVVAVGECGLDFFYNNSPRDQQIIAFKEQLKIAREFDKPVIIHCRDAWEEMLTILAAEGKGLTGVMHCYTGDEAMVRRIQNLKDFHAYISFSGIVTFTKAVPIQAAAKIVDKDRLLVETDSPFLAPQTVRGKRNEPANVWLVAEKLAQLREESLSDIALCCSNNAKRLFRLPV